jgi:hypothetical protein
MTLLLLSIALGCVPKKVLVHNPPLGRNVHQIVRGQTTKSQILARFGLPDIEADGSRSKVNANTPLAIWWGEYLKAAPEWTDAMPYSGIGSNQEALFYVEFFAKGILGTVRGARDVPMLTLANEGAAGVYRGEVARNRLLVLINRDTGIVEDFAYREEFKGD